MYALKTVRATAVATRPLGPQVQLLFDVDTVYAFVVVGESLPAQKHVGPPEGVPHSGRSNLAHPHAKQLIGIVGASVIIHRRGEHDTEAGPSNRRAVVVQKPYGHVFAQARVYSYIYHVLKYLLIQTQIRDQLHELFILFFELTQAPQLVRAHAGILLLPFEELSLGNSNLAPDLVAPGTCFRLLKVAADLGFVKL